MPNKLLPGTGLSKHPKESSSKPKPVRSPNPRLALRPTRSSTKRVGAKMHGRPDLNLGFGLRLVIETTCCPTRRCGQFILVQGVVVAWRASCLTAHAPFFMPSSKLLKESATKKMRGLKEDATNRTKTQRCKLSRRLTAGNAMTSTALWLLQLCAPKVFQGSRRVASFADRKRNQPVANTSA